MAGADPQELAAIAPQHLRRLRAAAWELSWLLSRDYAELSALKLVGDRHQLTKRQRMVVRRCATPPKHAAQRQARRCSRPDGLDIAVDGFNQLVTTERGLAGGAVLRGRDGVVRDIASVHGTWRRSGRTAEALALLFDVLQPARSVVWILDAPVSNSGRLAALVRDCGASDVRLEARADHALIETGCVLATGDGPVIDRAVGWLPLAELALSRVEIYPTDLSTTDES